MADKTPTKFGLLLYPGFEVLDVFGPLEALNVISREDFLKISPVYIKNVSLSIIAETMEPVSPGKPGMAGSSLAQKITPEYTLENAPALDVLLIPGGLGSDDVPDVVIQWLQDIFPSLQYLITVCTGADLAARAGLLNGLRATTNKMAWKWITSKPTSHKTYWVADARWVKGSPKIWTTSGVSAGTDGVIAWIEEIYGADLATNACTWMEYIRDSKPECDPFSKGLHDVPPTET